MSYSPEQDLAWLETHKKSYRPSEQTKQALGEKVLVMVVGPSAVGKSTIIDGVLSIQSPDLCATGGSLTTRQRRHDDPPHYQTADEGVTPALFRELALAGELTNYSVVGQHVYGSAPESFPARYNFLPTLTDSVADNQRAGFRRTEIVYVLADAMQWHERLTQRIGDERFHSRLSEALVSLDFAEANRESIHFVDNSDGLLKNAVHRLTHIALSSKSPYRLDNAKIDDMLADMRAVAQESLTSYAA